MKKKVLAITAVAILAQGTIGVEAKAASVIEGEKTNVKEPEATAVSGRVVNEQGEALPGVVVRCGSLNVQTDINGEFTVNANKGDKLTFSYIGYNTTTKDADNKDLKVVMTENSHALGEVLVTTQKKKQSSLEVPVAVSAVTGSMLGKLNMYQLDDVAQLAPGVQIQLQSPNNPGYVIRGVTSDAAKSVGIYGWRVYIAQPSLGSRTVRPRACGGGKGSARHLVWTWSRNRWHKHLAP